MIIEKWALPFFKDAGLQPATTSTAARTDIECAGCQTLWWNLPNSSGCYTDGQRQEIDTADTWACPTRAGLNNAQEIDRECLSIEELIRVIWMPSWESEETKETWPTSNSVCLNLKPSRANLTCPDPQQTLPFLTLKDKALKSLILLTLGGRNLTQNYSIKLPLIFSSRRPVVTFPYCTQPDSGANSRFLFWGHLDGGGDTWAGEIRSSLRNWVDPEGFGGRCLMRVAAGTYEAHNCQLHEELSEFWSLGICFEELWQLPPWFQGDLLCTM
eukprot:1150613-Pelagomonas_calceolata.AAC.1